VPLHEVRVLESEQGIGQVEVRAQLTGAGVQYMQPSLHKSRLFAEVKAAEQVAMLWGDAPVCPAALMRTSSPGHGRCVCACALLSFQRVL
jgi:hypothetical protein